MSGVVWGVRTKDVLLERQGLGGSRMGPYVGYQQSQ